MAKVKVDAITRSQKYLAAIAGDGTAPAPVTDCEKLLYNIAEKTNEESVPGVNTADYGKYLHANGETGELEWEDVETDPGVQYVQFTYGTAGAVSCNKTYAEISTMSANSGIVFAKVRKLYGTKQYNEANGVLSHDKENGVFYVKTFTSTDGVVSANIDSGNNVNINWAQ